MLVLDRNDFRASLFVQCMFQMLLVFHRTMRKLFVPEINLQLEVIFRIYSCSDESNDSVKVKLYKKIPKISSHLKISKSMTHSTPFYIDLDLNCVFFLFIE